MTDAPIRLLLIEDDARDSELMLRALHKDGIACDTTIVRSRADLARLQRQPFDVIITDYRLPDLTAADAIAQIREHQPDVPFVVVSGSTSEEQLLAMLRLGADDYLLKDRLTRLGAAVRSAYERLVLRRERTAAELVAGQRELEMRHLQRVDSIGLLAGGVAHEMRNLLTVVLGNAELAQDALPGGHDAGKSITEVIGAARRAASLTGHLLAFVRRQPTAPQPLDLVEVVESFVRLTRAALGSRIQVQFAGAAGLPAVLADRAQIEQVLMNLLLNARDAMPDGGTIQVGVETAVGHRVQFRVRDTGHGMTPEVMSRLCEPFFTTKPVGVGTGLGLSTARAIVHQLGGELEIASAPGEGSEFRVRLPAHAPTPSNSGTR